ncbi:MAG: hypothetical protein AB7I25_02495 [Vicinamibacterales bacterium]
MTRTGLLLALVALWIGPACSRVPPLAGARESPEAVVRAVLQALASRDRAALDALVLSEQEFKDHVWPHLPAARPERNLPFSYVWGDLHQKSRQNLSRTVREFGGKRLRLERVSFSGQTAYPGAVVHREAVVTVTDERGYTSDVRVCGSLIEQGGRWKVFSYVTED